MPTLPTLVTMTTTQGRIAVTYARLVTGGYLLLGLMGLLMTGFDFFSNVTGVPLFIFTVNPLTNVIHILVGLVGIPMASDPVWARRLLLLLGTLGVPFAIAGYVLDGTLSDFFARNPELTTTHLLTAVAALLIALWPAPRRAEASEAR